MKRIGGGENIGRAMPLVEDAMCGRALAWFCGDAWLFVGIMCGRDRREGGHAPLKRSGGV